MILHDNNLKRRNGITWRHLSSPGKVRSTSWNPSCYKPGMALDYMWNGLSRMHNVDLYDSKSLSGKHAPHLLATECRCWSHLYRAIAGQAGISLLQSGFFQPSAFESGAAYPWWFRDWGSKGQVLRTPCTATMTSISRRQWQGKPLQSSTGLPMSSSLDIWLVSACVCLSFCPSVLSHEIHTDPKYDGKLSKRFVDFCTQRRFF